MNDVQTIEVQEKKEMAVDRPARIPLSPEQAKAQMVLYQDFVKALLVKEDFQQIGTTQFKKKSAWRKLALGFALSIKVVGERREELQNGNYAYHFICESENVSGRVVSGSGSCEAYEDCQFKDGTWKREKKIYEQGRFVGKQWVDAIPNSVHNVRSTAETRAFNRCVSNMVAAGEVSAEEVRQGMNDELPVIQQTQTPLPQVAASTSVTQDHPIIGVPECPKCKGPMWDNRETKDKPTQPDFVCKNKECRNEKGFITSIWVPKPVQINDNDVDAIPFD